jgi:high affinity Mn2+ porin
MEYNIHAHSETLELTHKISVNNYPGHIRLLVSNTYSKAPSYEDGLKAIETGNSFLLGVFSGDTENTHYGGRKFALGLNVEQQLHNDIGVFSRLGWNDGKYASWAFTEIDQTINVGLSIKGRRWNRTDDVCGIAGVWNGISKEHRAFLKEGGYGFIIGDGNLNYGHEDIIEAYYNARLTRFFWLTFDYQFVNNPGYNKDRGPVHVFGLRGHIGF